MGTPAPIRPRTLALAGLGASALLLVPAVAPAHAAPVRGGTASQGENVVRGAGSGTAQAEVEGASGAIDLESFARGGQNILTPLGIAFLGGATSAGASGSLSQALGEVGPGTYEVVVTFQDAASTSQNTGTGTTSELRSVFAGFACESGCVHAHGDIQAGRFEEMPGGPETVTTTVVVTVPEGETGRLWANVAVSATATAHRNGNAATSTASVSAISTEVVER